MCRVCFVTDHHGKSPEIPAWQQSRGTDEGVQDPWRCPGLRNDARHLRVTHGAKPTRQSNIVYNTVYAHQYPLPPFSGSRREVTLYQDGSQGPTVLTRFSSTALWTPGFQAAAVAWAAADEHEGGMGSQSVPENSGTIMLMCFKSCLSTPEPDQMSSVYAKSDESKNETITNARNGWSRGRACA